MQTGNDMQLEAVPVVLDDVALVVRAEMPSRPRVAGVNGAVRVVPAAPHRLAAHGTVSQSSASRSPCVGAQGSM